MSSRYFCAFSGLILSTIAIRMAVAQVSGDDYDYFRYSRANPGRRLFEQETFGGNGRTCQTCHGSITGTLSPEEVRRRFAHYKHDPLFQHDGSDNGFGAGFTRILRDATILVTIDLPSNVSLADDPTARTVTLRRGIPSTLNTPALDPVLMLDGREPTLEAQARHAIHNHAQSDFVSEAEMQRIASFERSSQFFSSRKLFRFARGAPPPELPDGRTESEIRGKRFFVDDFSSSDRKVGICAACHSGSMLNTTNRFAPPPLTPGLRFQSIAVSELNEANNPVREFIFHNPDGTTASIKSPDPGRALITGESQNVRFDNVNAFKIPSLWGVRKTAPYFHDNSAKTLEDVAAHYAKFFKLVTASNPLILTEEDQKDIVAYMKLLE